MNAHTILFDVQAHPDGICSSCGATTFGKNACPYENADAKRLAIEEKRLAIEDRNAYAFFFLSMLILF